MAMKIGKALRIAFFVMPFLFSAALSMAAEHEVYLKAGPEGKGASGEAVIKDAGAGQKEIAISVKGLKPNGVYTVWFVNMKPKMDMAGIGTPDYVIKIDDKGAGSYTATIPAGDLEKWQMIEIAYHKTGDPKDMKKMGVALKGELYAMSKGKKGW